MCELEGSIPQETMIHIKLSIGQLPEPIEIAGEVVWSERVNGNGISRIGIEFMKVEKGKQNLIVQYVYSNGNGHY